jgi:hypothetical protein
LNGQLVWMVVLALVSVALIVAFRLLNRKRRTSGSRWPVYAKRLLGDREQVLYWRLTAAIPEHVVLAQVSLSQLLGVDKGSAERHTISNRFRQLSADFVICDRMFKPVAVIELDGLSHDHPRRQAADLRKATALASAGVPLIRLNVAKIPNENELQEMLAMTQV